MDQITLFNLALKKLYYGKWTGKCLLSILLVRSYATNDEAIK